MIIHALINTELYPSIVKNGIQILVDIALSKIPATAHTRILAAQAISYLAFFGKIHNHTITDYILEKTREPIRKAGGLNPCLLLLNDSEELLHFGMSGVNYLISDEIPAALKDPKVMNLLIRALFSVKLDIDLSNMLKVLTKDGNSYFLSSELNFQWK